MIGASFDESKTKVKGIIIRLDEFALGAGYGYNFVPSSHWLFHLSALPTITVYSHDYTKMKAEVEEGVICNFAAPKKSKVHASFLRKAVASPSVLLKRVIIGG